MVSEWSAGHELEWRGRQRAFRSIWAATRLGGWSSGLCVIPRNAQLHDSNSCDKDSSECNNKVSSHRAQQSHRLTVSPEQQLGQISVTSGQTGTHSPSLPVPGRARRSHSGFQF